MQKIESQKWIFSREFFSDYAMDKLTLMAPLKPDENNIQLLINEWISSVAIKATAASLKIDSLDEFLRDMQHITATCNDVKKSSTTFKKNKLKIYRPDSLKTDQDKNGKNYSIHIVVEEITSKKIASSSKEESN